MGEFYFTKHILGDNTSLLQLLFENNFNNWSTFTTYGRNQSTLQTIKTLCVLCLLRIWEEGEKRPTIFMSRSVLSALLLNYLALERFSLSYLTFKHGYTVQVLHLFVCPSQQFSNVP